MLIVTIAALLMAASLAWFAYRLLQEEHRRSEARVALLTAALEDDSRVRSAEVPLTAPRAWGVAAAPRPAAAPVRADGVKPPTTATSVTTPDIVMLDDDTHSVQAFRSERAVAARGADAADVLRSPVEAGVTPARDAAVDPPVRQSGLFADAPAAAAAPRALIATVAAGVLGLLVLAYALVGWGSWPGPSATATAAPPAGVPPAQAAASGVPIELTSLSHVQRDGSLVVRGAVRNPVSGSNRPLVVAHVALLDAGGVIVASADAALSTPSLASGRSAAFAVRLAAQPGVRRYRVTFRDGTGAQIEHVDRRSK